LEGDRESSQRRTGSHPWEAEVTESHRNQVHKYEDCGY
jgi:hypothetical protein